MTMIRYPVIHKRGNLNLTVMSSRWPGEYLRECNRYHHCRRVVGFCKIGGKRRQGAVCGVASCAACLVRAGKILTEPTTTQNATTRRDALIRRARQLVHDFRIHMSHHEDKHSKRVILLIFGIMSLRWIQIEYDAKSLKSRVIALPEHSPPSS